MVTIAFESPDQPEVIALIDALDAYHDAERRVCRCAGSAGRRDRLWAPIVTRVCWCRLCQYLGAGSGTVNTCFTRESVIIKGALSDFASIAESGNKMHRRFCPVCGTHLFSEAESRPHLIFIRSGTLDDPEIGRPSATIWTAAAPTWACISNTLPSFTGEAPAAAQVLDAHCAPLPWRSIATTHAPSSSLSLRRRYSAFREVP